MAKLPLSAIVIAKNEAACIARCLQGLQWAEEILVVDSGSTDDTLALAEENGARIIQQNFGADFAEHRNLAVAHAKCDWVCFIDADEVCSATVPERLRGVLAVANKQNITGIELLRREIIFGSQVFYGKWFPHYQLRIYQPAQARWVGAVHEHVEIRDGSVSRLGDDVFLTHYSYVGVAEFFRKYAGYARIDAASRLRQGKRFHWYYLARAKTAFFSRYVKHKGFRDGWRGLVLAVGVGWYYMIVALSLLVAHQKSTRE